MANKIIIRNGTSVEWQTANPILSLGEEGYESDTNKAKYGDGITAWNDLDYFNEYELPQATETVLGGIKAKEKTTESTEVAIDPTTGKLYVPTVAGTLTGLTDVPDSYTDNAGKVLSVKGTEDGVEFVAPFVNYTDGGVLVEDFEDLAYNIPFTTTHWTRVEGGHNSAYCIKSPHTYMLTPEQYTISFDLGLLGEGFLSFWYKTTKELAGQSVHTFKLNGVTILSGTNIVDWTYFEIPVLAGVYTLDVVGSSEVAWYSEVYIDDLSVPLGRDYKQGIHEHSGMPIFADNAGKLLKVNATGTAVEAVDMPTPSTMTIIDTAGHYTATTVEDTLAEIGSTLDGLEEAINAIVGV